MRRVWPSSRSSRGPGLRPLTAPTGVRIPYGTPMKSTYYLTTTLGFERHTAYLRHTRCGTRRDRPHIPALGQMLRTTARPAVTPQWGNRCRTCEAINFTLSYHHFRLRHPPARSPSASPFRLWRATAATVAGASPSITRRLNTCRSAHTGVALCRCRRLIRPPPACQPRQRRRGDIPCAALRWWTKARAPSRRHYGAGDR
jgi:hypothetical protein